jgi:hypothetical protein
MNEKPERELTMDEAVAGVLNAASKIQEFCENNSIPWLCVIDPCEVDESVYIIWSGSTARTLHFAGMAQAASTHILREVVHEDGGHTSK